MLKLDFYTKIMLVIIGAFGSYSLGANNIANVMGVFLPDSPFSGIRIAGFLKFSSAQELFLIGAIAIALGIITYSKRVMMTVGNSIFRLSPVTAVIIVVSSSLVLFLFASSSLKFWLISHHLPSFPLVPVSSSQAVVGAVMGIGLAKGGKNIRYEILGKISLGWISTPLFSGLLSFILLFFMQNVFMLKTYKAVEYYLDNAIIKKLSISDEKVKEIMNKKYKNAVQFKNALDTTIQSSELKKQLMENAKYYNFVIDDYVIKKMKMLMPKEYFKVLKKLKGTKFHREWEIDHLFFSKIKKIDKREYRFLKKLLLRYAMK